MKAIAQDVYGSAEMLKLREVDQPSIGDKEVLVEVRAAGVDPGVWIVMTGRPYAVRLAFGLRRPRVPVRGMDVAGVVTAVGARVTRFRPGDEVYGTCETGAFADYTTAREQRLAVKPTNISFAQAAAVPVSGVTALVSVRDGGRVQPGQRVLITGAGGGVGSFAVQLVKAAGASVTGVCSTSKVDLVRSLGADDVIDYTQQEIDRDGARYDVVIDTAGNRPLSLLRRAATPRGTIALVGGYPKGRVMGGYQRQMAAPLISLFMSQRLTGVTGVVRAGRLEELTRLIESGEVTPAVGGTYALADAPEAIRDLVASRFPGKLVVTV